MFEVAPLDPGARVVERGYLPGTLILRTVWRADGGELAVHDALACDGDTRLVRTVRAIGAVEVGVRVALAPDAARARGEVAVDGDVLRVHGGGIHWALHAPARWMVQTNGAAICHFTTDSTERAVVLCDASAAAETSLEATERWFAERVAAARSLALSEVAERSLGAAHARLLIEHSAAVLAGLRQRGGGIVAAPTTSLPQWPETSRTWDYRYSWLRDTALAGLAMLRCGLVDDAAGLGDFVGVATASMPPAVLCCVDGTASPPEVTLDHLRGYRGARPVRVGNAASDQPQLDVAGEVLELAAALAAHDALPRSLREGVVRLADWTMQHWTEPDHGIWEIRGAPRLYTHSRVMAWAGLVQAVALAEGRAIDDHAAQWTQAIRNTVLALGGGALSLTDAGGGADAALAQAGIVGFLEPGDPRLRATLDSITGTLDRAGLMDRHLPEEDTSDEPCGPFVFPTFWIAQALERCGRDGSRHFTAALAARGSVDLFGEVADPGDMSPLGNYPQVQSHAAFVLAATQPPPPP